MLGFSFSWQLAWRASFGWCQRNEFERREVNIWYGRSRAGVTTEWERQLTVSDTVGWASMARNGSCNWYGWLAASAGLAGECGRRYGKGERVVPGTAGDAAWRASAAQVDGRSMCMGSQHGWCRQWWRGGTGGASTVVALSSAALFGSNPVLRSMYLQNPFLYMNGKPLTFRACLEGCFLHPARTARQAVALAQRVREHNREVERQKARRSSAAMHVPLRRRGPTPLHKTGAGAWDTPAASPDS